jgi:hypothetical protein
VGKLFKVCLLRRFLRLRPPVLDGGRACVRQRRSGTEKWRAHRGKTGEGGARAGLEATPITGFSGRNWGGNCKGCELSRLAVAWSG